MRGFQPLHVIASYQDDFLLPQMLSRRAGLLPNMMRDQIVKILMVDVESRRERCYDALTEVRKWGTLRGMGSYPELGSSFN